MQDSLRKGIDDSPKREILASSIAEPRTPEKKDVTNAVKKEMLNSMDNC